jgi:NADH:ubiquinone oxidoreductase subunit 2 (subunit N)
VAAAYYLRIVATMYFRSPETAAAPVPSDSYIAAPRHLAPAIAAALCLLLVVAAGVLPNPIMQAAEVAGSSLRQTASDTISAD